MAESINRQCALDVNVLIDLAEGKPFALDFLGVVHDLFCPLWVSPTAFLELEHLLLHGSPQQRAACQTVFNKLQREWQIAVFNIDPIEHGYADSFAKHSITKGYLPADEYNDGLILAESAIYKIPVLVTSDKHLLDIPRPYLRSELISRFSFQTVPVKPQVVINTHNRK